MITIVLGIPCIQANLLYRFFLLAPILPSQANSSQYSSLPVSATYSIPPRCNTKYSSSLELSYQQIKFY